jgi:hypothetical protein
MRTTAGSSRLLHRCGVRALARDGHGDRLIWKRRRDEQSSLKYNNINRLMFFMAALQITDWLVISIV